MSDIHLLDSSGRTTESRYLTDADKALIYQLSIAGKTQTDIAAIVGCHHSSVGRWLSQLTSTIDLARKRSANRALEVAESAINGAIKASSEGKPEAALEILDRLDVAPKRQTESSRGTAIQIVVGMPGSPAGPDVVVNALSPSEPKQLAE